MNRKDLLRRLAKLWKADGHRKEDPVFLEDILDDLSSLGMDGASDAYIDFLKK